jgi:hypothetical protein
MITHTQITIGFKFKINNILILKDEVFKVGDGYIFIDKRFGKQMNIEKIDTKKINLYSFDMLGNMSKGEIRFEDMEEVVEQ